MICLDDGFLVSLPVPEPIDGDTLTTPDTVELPPGAPAQGGHSLVFGAGPGAAVDPGGPADNRAYPGPALEELAGVASSVGARGDVRYLVDDGGGHEAGGEEGGREESGELHDAVALFG